MSSGSIVDVRATSVVSDTVDTLALVLFGDTDKIRGGLGANMGGNGNPTKFSIGKISPSI